MGGGANRRNRSSVDADLSAVLDIRRVRDNAEAGHGTDGGERLPTESERDDGFEIIERGDLARGMPGHRDRKLVSMNPAAIVPHANEADPAAFHVDLDPPGA